MTLYELRQKPHLSASSVGDYIDCGMLYKFGRVDRLHRGGTDQSNISPITLQRLEIFNKEA